MEKGYEKKNRRSKKKKENTSKKSEARSPMQKAGNDWVFLEYRGSCFHSVT